MDFIRISLLVFCAFFSLKLEHVSGQFTPEDLIVDAGPLGKIEGTAALTAEDRGIRKDYIQFRGIPYANVTERFSPSVPFDGPLSADIFPATRNGLSCHQPFSIPPLLTEECLSINIYTPKKWNGSDRLKPVIFFIHGGAFTVGQGGSFSGLRILNRDVVYVSFNYRLGLLGFYSLNNEDIPGNAAMYDVVNALTWTNKYIKYFGGDPHLVTIAGQSAGAVTVTQLLASPMARGLFQRALAASGSALTKWGTTVNPLTESLKIAETAGCFNSTVTPNPDLTLVAQCMRAVPPMDLVDLLLNYQIAERQAGRLGFAVVSPVVQNFPMTKYPKFLEEHPEETFKYGRQANVPLLMGNTKHDGSYVLGVVYNRFIKDMGRENDTQFLKNELVPSILKSLDIEDRAGVYDTIAKTHLGDARLTGDFNAMYPGLMDIFSVFFFKADCYNTVKHHSKINNNTYWYSFDYKGSVSLFTSLFNGDNPPFPGGVTHTDDLIYLYSLTFAEFNDEEREVSSRMLDYWANFALTGNPTPVSPTQNLTIWPELRPDNLRFMYLDTNSTEGIEYAEEWVGPGLETVPDAEQTGPSTEQTTQISTDITAEPTTDVSTEFSEEPTTGVSTEASTAVTSTSTTTTTEGPTGPTDDPTALTTPSAASRSFFLSTTLIIISFFCMIY